MNIEGGFHSFLNIIISGNFEIKRVDWVRSSFKADNPTARVRLVVFGEEINKSTRLQSCTANDNAQLRTLFLDFLQQTKQDVRVQRPLMGLINHDHSVSGQ